MWYALKGTDHRPDGEEIHKVFGVSQDRSVVEHQAEGVRSMVCTPIEIVEVSDEDGERYNLLA